MKTIHFSESFAKFLINNADYDYGKIARILYKIARKEINNDLFKSAILTDKEVNFLTFRNDGTISYLPSGKECVLTSDGKWSKENRQSGKPSKVIRKLFTPRSIQLLGLVDKDFEQFTNSYKATFNDKGLEFKLLERHKIKSVYDADLSRDCGSLGGSCMNGDSDYMDIYSYCDKLQILTLWDKDGLLSGRALIWTIQEKVEDANIEPIILMDRIYVTDDYMYDLFLEYASEHALWRKVHYKTYDNKEQFINPQGEHLYKTFKIFTDTDFNQYPYIDTFSYGGDGWLTNSSDARYEYEYTCTDGTREGGNQVYDDIDECMIYNDDAVYIDCGRYRYNTTHVNNAVDINGIWWWIGDEQIKEVNGEYYHVDDLCYIVSTDEYVLADDAVWSERDGQYYLYSDCIEADDDYILTEDAVEIDGTWYHVDDAPESALEPADIVKVALNSGETSNDPAQLKIEL